MTTIQKVLRVKGVFHKFGGLFSRRKAITPYDTAILINEICKSRLLSLLKDFHPTNDTDFFFFKMAVYFCNYHVFYAFLLKRVPQEQAEKIISYALSFMIDAAEDEFQKQQIHESWFEGFCALVNCGCINSFEELFNYLLSYAFDDSEDSLFPPPKPYSTAHMYLTIEFGSWVKSTPELLDSFRLV